MEDGGASASRRGSLARSPSSSPRSSASESEGFLAQAGIDFERVAERSVSFMQAGVRDVRHRLANAALAIHEGSGQKVRELVGGLVAEDAELKSKAEAIGLGEAPERWWYSACQDAHRVHRLEDDPPAATGELAPGCHGWLEAEFLSVEHHPLLLREDGEEALDPVCQFSLGGRNTGMLRPAEAGGSSSSTNRGEPVGSTARFAVEEVAGTDLRVNVFDCSSSHFRMGFEHQAFCGGAFVPLLALIKHSTGSSGFLGLPLGQRFEVRMQLALLPLGMLRRRRKLEPADLTGAKQPEDALGRIRLRLLLTLRERAATLLVRQPRPPAAAPVARPPVGDAAGVMNAAGAAAARIGRACSVDGLTVAVDELREELVPATVLYIWWSFIALLAPVWLWPVLLVAILPLVSWKFGHVMRRAAQDEPLRLYVDEVPSSSRQRGPTEQVQKAVKDVVHAQLTLMQLVESCNKAASQMEKAKLVVAIADSCVSTLCGLLLLTAAAGTSATLWALLALGSGTIRFVLWLAGSCVLLPRRGRAALMELAERAGLLEGNSLSCLWQRAPDDAEARHLRLVERYALIGAWKGPAGAPSRTAGAAGS